MVLDGSNLTAMNAFIDTGTQYWTIQNITWSTSYGTNSGSQAIIQTQNGAAFGLIQNNHIDVVNSADIIFMHGVTHDVTIQNNYLRISTPTGDGFDTDGVDTEGAYNVMVQGNYIGMQDGAAQQSCGGCHDDLTQVFSSTCPGLAVHSCTHDWTYRWNLFQQASSPTKQNNLSWMIEEQISAGQWNVYGNIFLCTSGGQSGNGIVFDGNCPSGCTGYSGGAPTFNIYGNTVVANSGAGNNLWNLSGDGVYNFEDNITYSTTQGNALTGGVTFNTRGKNLWYGSPSPSCSGTTDRCGSDPLFTNYSTNDFSRQSGSPARNLGANLGTSYNGYALAETTWPNPSLGTRPASGNWDTGYTQYSTSNPVATPTFSPAAGLYAIAQSVTISTKTGGATICYTTDGSTPTANGAGTCTHGTTYSPAVNVSTSLTLKATGSESGFVDSSVGSAAYTIGSVSLTPTSYTWGSTIVGVPSPSETFTLSNTSGVTVTSIVVTTTGTNAGDFARTGGTCSTSLATGSSCTIIVVFTPGATGSRSGTLNVADSDSSSPQQSSLSGTGINGTVTISPTSQSFGSVNLGNSSSPVSFTLTNTNATAITGITVSFVTGNTGDFTNTLTGTCGSSLGGSQSCTIKVVFSPTAAGARSTALNVADSATSSPQQSTLSGTGTALATAPAAAFFGS